MSRLCAFSGLECSNPGCGETRCTLAENVSAPSYKGPEFLPGTRTILDVRQVGEEVMFTSSIPPYYTRDHFELLASLVLQHIATNAKVSLPDFYAGLKVAVETAEEAKILVRHTTQ